MKDGNYPSLPPEPEDATPGAPQQHRAPPPGWRPMSGLALTAFILAILLGLAAVFLGLWWLAVATGILGVMGLRRAQPARFRGRGFAIAAIVLSVIGALLGYTTTSGMRSEVKRITTDVCRSLSADGVEDEKRIHRLNDWLHERAEEGTAERVLASWRQVGEKMGAYTEPLEPFSIFSGWAIGVFKPPADLALVDIEDATRSVPGIGGGKIAMWSRVQFEKGVVHIGFFLYGASSGSFEVQSRLQSGSERARLFEDIRFYVPETVE